MAIQEVKDFKAEMKRTVDNLSQRLSRTEERLSALEKPALVKNTERSASAPIQHPVAFRDNKETA